MLQSYSGYWVGNRFTVKWGKLLNKLFYSVDWNKCEEMKQTKKSSYVPITGGCPLRLNFFSNKIWQKCLQFADELLYFHFPVWPGINLFKDVREMLIQRLLYCGLIFLNINIIEWSLIKGLPIFLVRFIFVLGSWLFHYGGRLVERSLVRVPRFLYDDLGGSLESRGLGVKPFCAHEKELHVHNIAAGNVPGKFSRPRESHVLLKQVGATERKSGFHLESFIKIKDFCLDKYIVDIRCHFFGG